MAHRILEVIAVVWALSLVTGPAMAQQAVEGAGKIITAPAEVPKGTGKAGGTLRAIGGKE